MENKHKKSKRSLNGDDVYELACRYDVGWSKSKSRKRRKDGEINDEQSDEGGKNVSSMVRVRKGLSKKHPYLLHAPPMVDLLQVSLSLSYRSTIVYIT